MIFSHRTRTRVAERLRRLIGGAPSRRQVAALPFRVAGENCEILLVTSRGTGRWVLPKGWPERDEALWDAAAREAREEAGVDGSVGRRKLGSFFYTKHLTRGRTVRCEVFVFPLEVEEVAVNWREEDQRTRRWVSPAEAARMVAESDLAELIAGLDAARLKAAG